MNPSLQQLAVTLLWNESDESTPQGGEPFGRNYSVCDIDETSLDILHQKFQVFLNKAEAEITKLKGSNWNSIDDFYTGLGTGGFYLEHDYILTVNHCGCGYWEKDDWEPGVGRILTDLALQEQEIHCYAQDGKVYVVFG
jgi:hypothetical protein